ncbi:hypothetical protein HK105_208877 [Polyrhizophydium stewartii]|uniref:Nuclear protein MDM1 n=1 Tax=Polyrhizophydium stewartii TaxID=2732419 RepID=A0ABR4MWP6_9FUNG
MRDSLAIPGEAPAQHAERRLSVGRINIVADMPARASLTVPRLEFGPSGQTPRDSASGPPPGPQKGHSGGRNADAGADGIGPFAQSGAGQASSGLSVPVQAAASASTVPLRGVGDVVSIHITAADETNTLQAAAPANAPDQGPAHKRGDKARQMGGTSGTAVTPRAKSGLGDAPAMSRAGEPGKRDALRRQVSDREEQSLPNESEFVPMFYGIPESTRLTERLVNRHNKDVVATVGSYNPHPLLWETSAQVRRKQAVKDVWGRMTKRFVEKDSKLAPGMYEPQQDPFRRPSGESSSFKSTQERFKSREQGFNVAPGSYEVEHKKVHNGFRPWVKGVQTNLGRVLEPSVQVPWGTPSRLLEKLSVDSSVIPKLTDAKKRLDEQVKSDEMKLKGGVSPAPVVKSAPAKPLHPFSQVYLMSGPIPIITSGSAAPTGQA